MNAYLLCPSSSSSSSSSSSCDRKATATPYRRVDNFVTLRRFR